MKQATAYRVQNCPSTHNGLKVYTIEISNLDGADNTCPGFNMRMGNWGIHEYVVTHEMGHGLGMGDTYKYAGGTHTPIGQPAAVMNNNWAVKGVLQRDDIDGIRHLWARLRGGSSACPAGYKTGDCIGSSCGYASFCVPTGNDPDDDPGDSCPNDPKKTSPGKCGCGVAEGTCAGTCTDNHSKCATWASIGECKINPDYMLVNCKRSCR